MFYDVSARAYSLLGVHRIAREGSEIRNEKKRTFSSLAVRLRGKSRFIYGEGSCVADEKSVIYIPSGVDFVRKSVDEELIILHLECHGTDDREITVLYADGVEEQFEMLLSDWEAGGIAYRNRCTSRLYRILETIEKENRPRTASVPNVILPGVSYLNERYREAGLSVAELASLCHVSEVYFRRIYRECFGTSPWQSILDLRFSYACELLQSGYYTVKEIAARTGFSDVKYFRTAFAKRYGCTPGSFAKGGGKIIRQDCESKK